MNTPPDLDRQVAAWLEDGPTRAPERAVDAALVHAQRHPRRFDPLGFLRGDPMPATRPAAILRPLGLVAVLGLLLVAAFAIATAGGLFREAPVVVPPPIVSPSAAPSVAPSATAPASPSQAPSPSAAPSGSLAVIHVDLIEAVGQDASIDIVDHSGTLTQAVSGTPGDGGSVADGEIQIVADTADPATLVLTWTGSPCDTTHTLTISVDGRTMTIERPACSGDSIPVDHVLRLTFGRAIDPATIGGTVVTTGG